MVLLWETVKSEMIQKGFFADTALATLRAKVPGGGFVQFSGNGAFFYPDPEHTWDGSSLP